jgi:hypothetical protein
MECIGENSRVRNDICIDGGCSKRGYNDCTGIDCTKCISGDIDIIGRNHIGKKR